MKRSTTKKGNPQTSVKNNKITSYFTKFKPPPVKSQASFVADDEDIIEDSPQKFFPPKKASAVLDDVTNTSPTTNEASTNSKKRKCLNKSFETDEGSEIKQPSKKKTTEGVFSKNNLKENDTKKSCVSIKSIQKERNVLENERLDFDTSIDIFDENDFCVEKTKCGFNLRTDFTSEKEKKEISANAENGFTLDNIKNEFSVEKDVLEKIESLGKVKQSFCVEKVKNVDESDFSTDIAESDTYTDKAESDFYTDKDESDFCRIKIESDIKKFNGNSGTEKGTSKFFSTKKVESVFSAEKLESDLPTQKVVSSFSAQKVESDYSTQKVKIENLLDTSEENLIKNELGNCIKLEKGETQIETDSSKNNIFACMNNKKLNNTCTNANKEKHFINKSASSNSQEKYYGFSEKKSPTTSPNKNLTKAPNILEETINKNKRPIISLNKNLSNAQNIPVETINKNKNRCEHATTISPNKSITNKQNIPEETKNKNCEHFTISPNKNVTNKQNSAIEIINKTPEKKFNSWTPSPGKNLSPSLNGCTKPSSRKKTPCKRTPKKLFEMSPNVKEFQVEVLNNFVKVTPSKREENKETETRSTPVKSVEMKQGSILQFTSPCTPRRSLQAQFSNEKTPEHKTTPRSQTPSSRIKVKLDFSKSQDISPRVCSNGIDEVKKLPSPDKKNVCDDGMDDDVGEAFFNDSWEENFEFTESYTLDLSTTQHCKILDIAKENFKQRITVQSTKSEDKAVCTLNDFWANVQLDVGSTLHLTAIQSDSSSEWVVNNNGGLLVYEPDFLISSTSVVGALFCKRKSVLKDRYAGFDPSNKAMLVGTLVHELLQYCLTNKTQNPKEVAKVVSDLLNSKNIVFQLYECGLQRSEIEEEMKTFIPRIITFMEQYLKMNLGSYSSSSNDRNNWKGKIDSIQDIEENLWCPELGIKGKVDVSVKVQGSIMPLELKTGRATMSLEHRGQIVLYIMMMNKFGYKVPAGLLLYLREGVVRDIPMNEREKRDLIILRNDLTYYLTRKPTIIETNPDEPNENPLSEKSDLLPGELPPPINHHSACGRCEYNTLCCIHLKKEQFDLNDFRNLSSVSEEVASHLKTEHVDYFMHWGAMLALENSIMEGKPLKDIYTKTPEERERNGKCIINTIVANKVLTTGSGLHSTTFTKKDPASCNLLTSGIGEGSYLVVSRDDRPAVAAGLVSHLDHQSVTVELDRNLTKKYPNSTFHLDTYDSRSINTFNFTSLSLLMEDTEMADKLRKLIIEKEKPTFKKTLPSEVGKKCGPILKTMNKMQQKAVIKALAANDYLLIKGMPGTGKTATIVALIQLLVELNYSVLLTSQTHLAVDNVCVRLQECGIDVLRLGSANRIHPKLKNRSEAALTKDCKTPEGLEEVYNNAKIIAVTCIGSKHPILSKRTMDICIVDESTQVLQPSVFRPLHASKKFILIGDPDQLPPIVKSREALARGLSQSLFERLQSPESLVMLTYNYRMNRTITSLANNLTYNGELLIANESVANATLRFTNFESLSLTYREKQWILQALSQDLNKSICVLDTGPVWNKNFDASWIHKSSLSREGGQVVVSCVNPSEAAVIYALVKALIKGGIAPSCIGVMAPYTAQISQLNAILKGTGVDINTVDQFQGQDKEVVLYSCTKSRDLNKPRNILKFEILEDKRRLTVAITRAKHKLIMVADVATIRLYSPFSKLFSSVNPDQCMQLTEGESGFNLNQLIEDCASDN